MSGCVEWLFAEAGRRIEERIGPAAEAGFDAVEFWNWRARDVAAIADAAERAGVRVGAVCVEPQGVLTDPAGHDAFVEALTETLEVAVRLSGPVVVTHTGPVIRGVDRARQHASVVSALRRVARRAEDAGLVLAVEPLNDRVDHPGYFLTDTAEAVAVVAEVASPAVRLLYDRYHAATMGEPIGYGLAGHLDLVAHVHLADTPGRHEPGTGDIDWTGELRWIAQNLPGVPVGWEFQPTRDTGAAMDAVRRVVAAAKAP